MAKAATDTGAKKKAIDTAKAKAVASVKKDPLSVDVYTPTGTKKATITLPTALFSAPINEGLMHQAVVRQQSNRRAPIAHTKTRGDIQGSTRKLFAQKGTGRARRGSIRANVLRGGNKAFGPKNNANFTKNMPKKMRRAALFSCLSLQAQNGAILGLTDYPTDIKTKTMKELLGKMPVDIGRRILFVVPEKHTQLMLSGRNIPGVKTIQVEYLNPEDILGSRHIVFLVDAIKKAEDVFTTPVKETKKKPAKKTATKTDKDSDSSPSA